VLVGASALAVMLLGRPGDAVTAGITTAVIMVVAAVSPQHAWQQPILRLADTVVGVAVGAVTAWTGMQVQRFLSAPSVPPDPAKVKVDLPERAMVRRPRPGQPYVAAR
jgi:multisubunit Na+/H+ antiporter MnhB subunit